MIWSFGGPYKSPESPINFLKFDRLLWREEKRTTWIYLWAGHRLLWFYINWKLCQGSKFRLLTSTSSIKPIISSPTYGTGSTAFESYRGVYFEYALYLFIFNFVRQFFQGLKFDWFKKVSMCVFMNYRFINNITSSMLQAINCRRCWIGGFIADSVTWWRSISVSQSAIFPS
jgi:hypothetical protein